MMGTLKDTARKVLSFLHLDLTKNLEYDRLTKKLIRQVVKPGSVCIDVGCHKGEILELFLKYAPGRKHYAFEPLPHLYDDLQSKFARHCTIYPYALGEKPSTATFQYVKNAPAYSGLQKRSYAIENPEIIQLEVQVETLDNVIGDEKIDLIKIDVEGGEFDVLKGAVNILRESRPTVIFECGLGASEHYGTHPEELFDYLSAVKMEIYTLPSFFSQAIPLSRKGFCDIYNLKQEYYFVARPVKVYI